MCSSTPGESSLIAAEQPGQGWSQSGPNITCCTISCRLSPNNWASVTSPPGPVNTYSVSTLTMGSRRRAALSSSCLRVISFSWASSRRLASSHCSRDTTSGRLIAEPPVRDRELSQGRRTGAPEMDGADGTTYADGEQEAATWANSELRSVTQVCATKSDHAPSENPSTGPSRFIESRSRTDLPSPPTSTQPPLLDAVLFRHTMHGSSKSATCPPPREVPGLLQRQLSHGRGGIQQPAGVQVKLL